MAIVVTTKNKRCSWYFFSADDSKRGVKNENNFRIIIK